MIWRIVKACGLSFCVLIPVFLLLLAWSLTIFGDDNIEDNLDLSIRKGALTKDQYPLSPFGHTELKFDMFSECVGLGENLGTTDRSLLYRMAATPYIGQPGRIAGERGEIPCADLVQAIENGHAKSELVYLRFWHGYQIYTRALLSIMTLPRLHMFNAILVFGSLVFLCIKLGEWFGSISFAALLLPLALETDILTVPLVTVHALSLAWAFLSIALVMTALERETNGHVGAFVMSFTCGSTFNFVSMLFNPPLTPAFLAFITMAWFFRSAKTRRDIVWALIFAASVAGVWFLGFAATWATKWIFAGIVLGFDTVRSSVAIAASGVKYRAYSVDGIDTLFYPTIFIASLKFRLGAIIAYLIATIVFTAQAMSGRLETSKLVAFALLQTPVLIIVAWVEILRYHSVEHAGFVERSFVTLVVFPLLALLFVTRGMKPSE